MYSAEQLFSDENERASFHDVFGELECLGLISMEEDISVEKLRELFEMLSVHVRDVAHCWGLSEIPYSEMMHL